MAEPALWLVGWSDSEDADFRASCAEAGLEAEVARVAPLGTTVGTRRHRLRTWPAYLRQARRALRWPGPVVAWDPIAGAVAARLGRHEGVVVLNPLLDPSRPSRRQNLVVSGARRAEQVLFFSRAGVEDALKLGIRAEFVPLGVRARREEAAPPGDHLLAVGRDHRDWETLARAAQALDIEVRVIGPPSVPGPLRLVDPVPRDELFELMEQAAAVVVPLADDRRTAGQLAVLDAFAVGRGVVATKGPGTEDYVTDDTGFLVPPGEADALRAALELAADPSVAVSLGEDALKAAQGPLSLTTFVAAVDDVARRPR